MTAPSSKLNLEVLQAATATAAAFRCRRTLQPGGGEGDKVFPPTYVDANYAVEKRHVPGKIEPVTCVLLDSVQSQANRMELALQKEHEELNLPIVEVDFTSANLGERVGKISTLQAPHRIADAILRDSELDGKAFRKSEIGTAITVASPQNATVLFKYCPTALIFGMWDSTGPKGGGGTKFERAVVSEVVGVNASLSDSHQNRGVRNDPLEIRAQVKITQNKDATWAIASDPKAKGTQSPSEINHGNIPFSSDNAGTTIEYAEQITTISLICLRRLRFPTKDAPATTASDRAAQTVLAALSLCAATLAFENGMALRSRCLLWPQTTMQWELLSTPGETPKSYSLTSDEAKALLKEAVAAAEKAGLTWPKEKITLKPTPGLIDLVRKSQEQAVKKVEDKSGN